VDEILMRFVNNIVPQVNLDALEPRDCIWKNRELIRAQIEMLQGFQGEGLDRALPRHGTAMQSCLPAGMRLE
jgi:hypothetical protein